MAATDTLETLQVLIADRRSGDPQTSYVAGLHARGLNKILEKIGEEATELLLAAKDGNPEQVIAECADLLFHTMVMLSHQGLSLADVVHELERRSGTSGLEEKASRST